MQICLQALYTARQCGEVVLPDASTGQGSDTLATTLSRCKARLRRGFGVQRRVWRTFCHTGTNFIEHYACSGVSLIGAASLFQFTKLVAGTGAVSQYNLSRSQKFVKVQDFSCVQMSALTAVASAKAGVRVQQPLQICLECRIKSKKCDKQLTFIVRISRLFLND